MESKTQKLPELLNGARGLIHCLTQEPSIVFDLVFPSVSRCLNGVKGTITKKPIDNQKCSLRSLLNYFETQLAITTWDNKSKIRTSPHQGRLVFLRLVRYFRFISLLNNVNINEAKRNGDR